MSQQQFTAVSKLNSVKYSYTKPVQKHLQKINSGSIVRESRTLKYPKK